jgi:hypothetical protein
MRRSSLLLLLTRACASAEIAEPAENVTLLSVDPLKNQSPHVISALLR